MSRKTYVSLVFLCFMFSFCITTILPVSAYLEPPINSGWVTVVPTINGSITPGEWADSAIRVFMLEMRSRTDGSLKKTLDGKLYVKNNLTHICAAVEIFNDDYEAQNFANQWNGLALLLEENYDGVVSAGDNGEGVTTWVGSPFYLKNDLYYTGSYWDADANGGKTNDGVLAWSHTNPIQGAIGNWTFEMVFPLVGTDGDAYDLAITSLPKTMGFKIWFQEPSKGTDGVYPDEPTITQNIQEIANAATFGTLILHPLYTLTITTTVGGTTSPAPGEHQYPYETSVDVLATADPGYEFDHWELDGSDVGTVNPYSVLMDENHTLHSVFVKIYTLTITTTVGGTTSPVPGEHQYPDGTFVDVLATTNLGYEFDHWELDGSDVGTVNPYSVLMDENHTLHSVFVEDLSVSISPPFATIVLGGSVNFISGVSGGTPPYAYQWYLDGGPVSGATSSSWTFTPASTGTYLVQLKVTDDRGRIAVSNTAIIEVVTAPVGGYSVSLNKPIQGSPLVFYAIILGLFSGIVCIIRRERK